MAWGAITKIGFLTLQTSRLDETLDVACSVLGLRETARHERSVYLSADAVHHEIIYRAGPSDALSHLSLEARDVDALATVRRRVTEAGFAVLSDAPLEHGIEQAFSFTGPDGFVFEIFTGLERKAIESPHFGPDRYGHVNLHPTSTPRMRDFLVQVLDFRVSDAIGDRACFLRCNADHHGIALIEGRGSLHHHGWATQSIAELGRIADRLDQAGRRLLWGPVRHGAGHNIAIYFEDVTGCVIEVYCDLEQIYDDDRPAVRWADDDPRWYNRWSDYRPDDFRRFGVMPVAANR